MWNGWSSVVWLMSVHSSSVPRTGAAIGFSVGWNTVPLIIVAKFGSLGGVYWKRNVRLRATRSSEKSFRGASCLGSGASGSLVEESATLAVASVWSTGTLLPSTTSTGSGLGSREVGGAGAGGFWT